MMKLFFLFTLLISFSAYSQSYEGGQTGNGGNGCWFEDTKGYLSWKTIEELRYWFIISPELARNRTRVNTEANDEVRIRARGSYYNVDMTNFKSVKRAKVRIAKLASAFPAVYGALKHYFSLLKSVTVTQYENRGVFEGDLDQLQFPCLHFAPAMLTVDEDNIYLIRPVWNEINTFSAEIVIVHEIIRFAQLFRVEFFDLSNDELQELTALLFSRKNYLDPKIHSILNRFENRLR